MAKMQLLLQILLVTVLFVVCKWSAIDCQSQRNATEMWSTRVDLHLLLLWRQQRQR